RETPDRRNRSSPSAPSPSSGGNSTGAKPPPSDGPATPAHPGSSSPSASASARRRSTKSTGAPAAPPSPRGSHPMTTTDTPARRPLLRRPPDTGPRASFRELLPYLREHTGLLSVAVVLSLVAAGLSLAQPALVSQVITVVQ